MTDSKLSQILFLAETFPFDLAGGSAQRWASLILTLTQSARVHLLCFQSKENSARGITTALKNFARKLPVTQRQKFLAHFSYDVIFAPQIDVPPGKRWFEWLKHFKTKQPFLVWQYSDQSYQNKLLELLQTYKPAVIHIGHLRLAQFLPSNWLTKASSKKHPRLIYEAQNVEWQLVKTQAEFLPKWGRWHWWWQREVALTKNFEKKVLQHVDQVFTLSEVDASQLRLLLGATKKSSSFITIWPITYPVIPQKQPPKLLFKKSIVPQLVFVGNLNWLPNADAMRWFLTEIWPAFAAEFTTATLTVIGQPCTYLSLVPKVAAERVQFRGFVPNLDHAVTANHIFILPFRMGSGVRLKALTAAWQGSAIVTTHLGIQGLGLQTEKNALIGETPQHFLHQLTRLAYDAKLRRKLSIAAQKYVQTQHKAELPNNFWQHYFGKTI